MVGPHGAAKLLKSFVTTQKENQDAVLGGLLERLKNLTRPAAAGEFTEEQVQYIVTQCSIRSRIYAAPRQLTSCPHDHQPKSLTPPPPPLPLGQLTDGVQATCGVGIHTRGAYRYGARRCDGEFRQEICDESKAGSKDPKAGAPC